MRKHLFAVLIAATMLAGAGVANAQQPLAQTHLPYANFDGYRTTLVQTNVTAGVIRVPAGFGVMRAIAPHASIRDENWPRGGGGVEAYTVTPGVVAYVEVVDPYDQRVRIASSTLIDPASGEVNFHDLLSSGGYDSYLFASAPDAAAELDLEGYGADGKLIISGGAHVGAAATIIPKLPAGVTRLSAKLAGCRVSPCPPAGAVYAFVLISHSSSRGEQFAVNGQ